MAESTLLTSNLTGLGALPEQDYYTNPEVEDRTAVVTNEDGTITVPKYQLEVNKPTFDLQNMQDLYGTKYMPMFRWISQRQTGTVTFDPNESLISDEEAERLTNEFESETGLSAAEALKEQYKQEAIGVGTQMLSGVGAQIGRAYAQTNDFGEATKEYFGGGIGEISGYSAKNDPSRLTSKITASEPFDQGLTRLKFSETDSPAGDAARKAIKSTPKNPLDADASTKYLESIKAGPDASDIDKAVSDVRADEYKNAMAAIPDAEGGFFKGVQDRSSFFGDNKTTAGTANLYGSLGAGGAVIVANLLSGKNLRKSVESGVKVTFGTFLGTALGGSIGGFIGGAIGGRVICNELMRQGLLTRSEVLLDYRFTRDYLTPTHVNGYHVWAVWMVKQMRKGRFVGFWKHVAGHRANEIAYIYGDRAVSYTHLTLPTKRIV